MRILVWAGIVGPIGFAVLLVLQGLLHGYEHLGQSVGALTAGPHGVDPDRRVRLDRPHVRPRGDRARPHRRTRALRPRPGSGPPRRRRARMDRGRLLPLAGDRRLARGLPGRDPRRLRLPRAGARRLCLPPRRRPPVRRPGALHPARRILAIIAFVVYLTTAGPNGPLRDHGGLILRLFFALWLACTLILSLAARRVLRTPSSRSTR